MACSSRHTKGLLRQLVGLRQPTTQLLLLPRDSTATNQIALLSSRAKDAVVLATEGKWVRVSGHTKPLINFTSRDIFGIQDHPLLDKAELDSIRIGRSVHVHPSHKLKVHPQQHLKSTLAQLHGKDDVVLTSHDFDVTLRTWLGEMVREGGFVFVPKDCTRLNGMGSERIQQYADVQELEKDLADQREASAQLGQRFVLVEAGVTRRSVQHLREVCAAAERQFATVVLLDPHAITHVKTALGEPEEILRVLRRPAIIQTSLSVLGANHVGCYVTGSRAHVTSCRTLLNAQTQIVNEQEVCRILKAIELLPARRINAQITNIHSLSLRLQLEGARISVNDAGMALSIHVHERTAAKGVSDALRRKGFLLDVEENGQNEYELQFAVNGHHTGDDITNFRIALLHELHKHGVIASPDTTNKRPAISYAFQDPQGGDIEEIASYHDIVQFERKIQARTEKFPTKLFNGCNNDKEARLNLRHTLVRTNMKSSMPKDVQDLTHLNDVYCWSEKDVNKDKEIHDNVMWASPLSDNENEASHCDVSDVTINTQVDGTSSSQLTDVSRKVANRNKVTDRKVPADMKYLENLYCTPMFDSNVRENELHKLTSVSDCDGKY